MVNFLLKLLFSHRYLHAHTPGIRKQFPISWFQLGKENRQLLPKILRMPSPNFKCDLTLGNLKDTGVNRPDLLKHFWISTANITFLDVSWGQSSASAIWRLYDKLPDLICRGMHDLPSSKNSVSLTKIPLGSFTPYFHHSYWNAGLAQTAEQDI